MVFNTLKFSCKKKHEKFEMKLPVCKTHLQSNTIMSVYATLIIFLVSGVVVVNTDALSYSTLSSGDGHFKLQWTYNNSKLIFKMTCKTTGWSAVGFTTNADGKKHGELRYSGCWVRF